MDKWANFNEAFNKALENIDIDKFKEWLSFQLLEDELEQKINKGIEKKSDQQEITYRVFLECKEWAA